LELTGMAEADGLLELWEIGQGLAPAARAAILVAFATGAESGADLPVGAGQARLFAFRRALFGSAIGGRADCPHCAASLEIAMRVEDFLDRQDGPDGAVHSFDKDGVAIRFRLPTLGDLAALDGDASVEANAEALLDRCIVTADGPVSPELAAGVVARMAELDPLGDIDLDLACGVCGTEFRIGFDIGHFLWREIESWAVGTLSDVHRLASAYGWREADILAVTPIRRRAYLDLIAT
jgi:hypothetical protein